MATHRVLYVGTCLQCGRPYQVIARHRCPACRRGRAEAVRQAQLASEVEPLPDDPTPDEGAFLGSDVAEQEDPD
jgi:hypothetical protein